MTDLGKKVRDILESRKDLEAQIEALYARKKELGDDLKEAQSQVELICQGCFHTMLLADAELIWEFYNERYCKIDEETYSSERLIWVCPVCSYITHVRDNDDPEWGNPRNLSKATYKWHSDPGSTMPEERVKVIMAPALERRARERAKRDREDELERARRVLRAAGEL